ncbi:hypothetical protein HZA99_04835 [Candidatus Woesearchaeota archaeon]|nr:hypothetical protein [Candidatus Woesearchaeota archaeon]
MEIKKLIWILISIALIPVGIIIGGIFFGVIAIIIIGIIALFLFLSLVIYLNKKFRWFIRTIKGTTQEYAEQESRTQTAAKSKSSARRTGNEEEIVIEQIEEKVEEKK